MAIDADPFTSTTPLSRVPGSGPLGTFDRVDTRVGTNLTTFGNPVFGAALAFARRRPPS